MSDKKQLLFEVEKLLKRVKEQVPLFQSSLEKFENANCLKLREKYKLEARREIRKLQKDKDTINRWLTHKDILNKPELLNLKHLIQEQMQFFKESTSILKTKPFSDNGLMNSQTSNLVSKDEQEIIDWTKITIHKLNNLSNNLECEIEELATLDKKKGQSYQKECTSINKVLENLKYYINQLETLLRMLINRTINFHEVKSLKEDVDYFIVNYKNPDDYYVNFEVFEDLGLESLTEYLCVKEKYMKQQNATIEPGSTSNLTSEDSSSQIEVNSNLKVCGDSKPTVITFPSAFVQETLYFPPLERPAEQRLLHDSTNSSMARTFSKPTDSHNVSSSLTINKQSSNYKISNKNPATRLISKDNWESISRSPSSQKLNSKKIPISINHMDSLDYFVSVSEIISSKLPNSSIPSVAKPFTENSRSFKSASRRFHMDSKRAGHYCPEYTSEESPPKLVLKKKYSPVPKTSTKHKKMSRKSTHHSWASLFKPSDFENGSSASITIEKSSNHENNKKYLTPIQSSKLISGDNSETITESPSFQQITAPLQPNKKTTPIDHMDSLDYFESDKFEYESMFPKLPNASNDIPHSAIPFTEKPEKFSPCKRSFHIVSGQLDNHCPGYTSEDIAVANINATFKCLGLSEFDVISPCASFNTARTNNLNSNLPNTDHAARANISANIVSDGTYYTHCEPLGDIHIAAPQEVPWPTLDHSSDNFAEESVIPRSYQEIKRTFPSHYVAREFSTPDEPDKNISSRCVGSERTRPRLNGETDDNYSLHCAAQRMHRETEISRLSEEVHYGAQSTTRVHEDTNKDHASFVPIAREQSIKRPNEDIKKDPSPFGPIARKQSTKIVDEGTDKDHASFGPIAREQCTRTYESTDKDHTPYGPIAKEHNLSKLGVTNEAYPLLYYASEQRKLKAYEITDIDQAHTGSIAKEHVLSNLGVTNEAYPLLYHANEQRRLKAHEGTDKDQLPLSPISRDHNTPLLFGDTNKFYPLLYDASECRRQIKAVEDKESIPKFYNKVSLNNFKKDPCSPPYTYIKIDRTFSMYPVAREHGTPIKSDPSEIQLNISSDDENYTIPLYYPLPRRYLCKSWDRFLYTCSGSL